MSAKKLREIQDIPQLNGKKVLVRIDSDVDIRDGKIVDDTRLQSSIETIRYLLNKQACVVLIGHLGRPDGVQNKNLTLQSVAQWYAKTFDGNVQEHLFGDIPGWRISTGLSLLENIRFYKNEEENDAFLARHLAALGDIYVNEAFAVSHRAHASTEKITHYLPSYAGIHLTREIQELSAIMQDPKRPLAVLIGGAKIETKLPMVEKMHRIADYVLVGGEIAEQVKTLLKVQHEKIDGPRSILLVADLTQEGLDITEKSAENFIQVLQHAQTIVWNGPVGLTGEDKQYEQGTKKIAHAISSSQAYTVVGGGDTLVYLKEEKLLDTVDFISTGGGAMLEYLSGKDLPAIKPLYY